MLKTRQFLLVVGMCLLALTHAATAAEQPTALFGKWYERNATGGTMIVEFTSSTMSMSPVTASGSAARAARTIKVSYQESGKIIEINMQGGGNFTAEVKDSSTIVLTFPGGAKHQMVRG